ncbi:MAG: HEAT repeat domain-containing protein [Pseudomonadota bacterium]
MNAGIAPSDLSQILYRNFDHVNDLEKICQALRGSLVNPDERMEAAYYLAMFGDDQGLEALRSALNVGEIENIESRRDITDAIRHLVNLGDVGSLGIMSDLLCKVNERFESIVTQMEEEYQHYFMDLEPTEESGACISMAEALAQAFRNLGDVRAVETLLAGLNYHNYEGVRSKLIEALNFFGVDVDEEKLPSSIPSYLLGRWDYKLFQGSYVALVDTCYSESLINPMSEIRFRHFFYDQSATTRRFALELVGRRGDARFRGYMRRGLRDPESKVRSMAIWALGQLRDYEFAELIANLLADSNDAVGRMAGSVLAEMGQEEILLNFLDQNGLLAARALFLFNSIKQGLHFFGEHKIEDFFRSWVEESEPFGE